MRGANFVGDEVDGAIDGDNDPARAGHTVGFVDGIAVGEALGRTVGVAVGEALGFKEDDIVGETPSCTEGFTDGDVVGLILGDATRADAN
jgi:hypothetical protein